MSLHDKTLELMDMLPSWMKMRSDPENSFGAKFMNPFGVDLANLQNTIKNIIYMHSPHSQLYENEVDITSIDIVYKAYIPINIDIIESVEGEYNGNPIPFINGYDVYGFYKDEEGILKFYFDEEERFIYIKEDIGSIIINNIEIELKPHMIWGVYDEIGLLLGCPRIYLEKNDDYRLRLKDVFERPGNASRHGLKNYLSRSLGLNIYGEIKADFEGVEIDLSDIEDNILNGYEITMTSGRCKGQHRTIIDYNIVSKKAILDKIFSNGGPEEEDKFIISPIIIESLDDNYIVSILDEDGNINDQLQSYIDISNKINANPYNNYWSIIEESKIGLSYLPFNWSNSLYKWSDQHIQNGIGFDDDCYVEGAAQEIDEKIFSYGLGVEALKIIKEPSYPEHQFKYKIEAEGITKGNGYAPEEYHYTILASENINLNGSTITKYENIDSISSYNFSDNKIYFKNTNSANIKAPIENGFTTDKVVIINGNKITNQNHRYVKILAKLKTKNPINTPKLTSITLSYKNSLNKQQKITFNGQHIGLPTSLRDDDITTTTANFNIDTWNINPIESKLKTRTERQENTGKLSNDIVLGKGRYSKTITTQEEYISNGSLSNLKLVNNEVTINL